MHNVIVFYWDIIRYPPSDLQRGSSSELITSAFPFIQIFLGDVNWCIATSLPLFFHGSGCRQELRDWHCPHYKWSICFCKPNLYIRTYRMVGVKCWWQYWAHAEAYLGDWAHRVSKPIRKSIITHDNPITLIHHSLDLCHHICEFRSLLKLLLLVSTSFALAHWMALRNPCDWYLSPNLVSWCLSVLISCITNSSSSFCFCDKHNALFFFG